MEALTMLKQWRAGGRGGFSSSAAPAATTTDVRRQAACTVANAVLGHSPETDDDDDFIDLEFTLPYELEEDEDESVEGDVEQERFGFALPSTVAGECCKPERRHGSNSLLKSANKFRVLMLSLQRSKLTQLDTSPKQQNQQHQQQQQSSRKFFVKLKREETPLVSLFARDSSSRSTSSSGRASKFSTAEENEKNSNNSTDMMQKYLNKIKPLYVRVSKRYGGKLRFTGPMGSTRKVGPTELAPSATPCHTKDCQKTQTTVSLPSGLKVVCRRLRKSRSSTSTAAAVQSPPSLPRRRDDSLLQQQDGIQSAIAHCKRSFQAPKALPEYPTELVRSNSDPGEKRRAEKIAVLSRIS